MTELFDEFPCLENDKVMIRKMELSDVVALSEISNNEDVYKRQLTSPLLRPILGMAGGAMISADIPAV